MIASSDRAAPDQPEPRKPRVERERRPMEPEVFGDVLPDHTEDEQSSDWREDVERDRDADLRDDVPPHY